MPYVLPSTYRHIQSAASTTWTIQHNLGGSGATLAAVDVLIDEGTGKLTRMEPEEVNIIDQNTVTVLFSIARAGEAVVVA